MTNSTTSKIAAQKAHLTFRVEEKLHAQATQIASSQGGLSAVIRAGFEDFLAGKVIFEQEKFQIDPSVSSVKDKRVSMKLDERIYADIQRKSIRFGGVSGLVRAILKHYCVSAQNQVSDKISR